MQFSNSGISIALVCYCYHQEQYINQDTMISQINNADIVIAVDSGLDYLSSLGIVADYAIGDFDSLQDFSLLNTNVKQAVINLPTNKDVTDLRAGINFCLTQYSNINIISIYTDFSGRIDQQLGVISQLKYLYDKKITTVIYSATHKLFLLSTGEHLIIANKNHQYFSFIAISSDVKIISSENLEYPLNGLSLELFAETGISNKALNENIILNLESGLLMCIETFNRIF